jgi:hypothetical protein
MRDLSTVHGARCLQRSDDGGIFVVVRQGATLAVIVSDGMGWDHVSVSLKHRTPNWSEMEHVKRMFFKDDETAMQLHVPTHAHISIHPYTLHLWRSQTQPIPVPPSILV